MNLFRIHSAIPIFVLMATFGCLPSSLFASINITNATTTAYVYDADNTSNSDGNSTLTGALATATLPGFLSTHEAVYGQNEFSHAVDQIRLGGFLDYSLGGANVSFTAQDNDTYSISGSFKNDAGYGLIQAHLYDSTANQYLYNSYQDYDGSAILDLAGTGLSGSLIAGHNYQWYFNVYTRALSGADDGTEASGSAKIQFFSAVPEPSSLLIWGTLGLVGLAGSRRRKVG